MRAGPTGLGVLILRCERGSCPGAVFERQKAMRLGPLDCLEYRRFLGDIEKDFIGAKWGPLNPADG